ncbi:MAG: ExbD/TolR family protein [Gemmobacter sp.]
MRIDPAASPARRRPNLTPMIDVVFLLMVFFMLVARFGVEAVVPVAPPGQGGDAWKGPPRLIALSPDGVRLNGLPVAVPDLPTALVPLMTAPDDPVVLRAEEGISLQQLLDLVTGLRAAGIARIVVAE